MECQYVDTVKNYVQFDIFLFTKYHNFMDIFFVTSPLLCEKH